MARFETGQTFVPIADLQAEAQAHQLNAKKKASHRITVVTHRDTAVASFQAQLDGVKSDYDATINDLTTTLRASERKFVAAKKELNAYEMVEARLSQLHEINAEQARQRGNDDEVRRLEIKRRRLVASFLSDSSFSQLPRIESEQGPEAVAPKVFRGPLDPQEMAALFVSPSTGPTSRKRQAQLASSGDPDAIAADYRKPYREKATSRRLELLGYDPDIYKERALQAETDIVTLRRRKLKNFAASESGPETPEGEQYEVNLTKQKIVFSRTTDDNRDPKPGYFPKPALKTHVTNHVGEKNLIEVAELIPQIEGFPGFKSTAKPNA